MKKLISVICLLIIIVPLKAQKIPLINYEESPLQFNSAFINYEYIAKFSCYHRRQKIYSGPNFSTSLFTGILPVYNDKNRGHFASVAISFLSDDLASGDLLREENFALAIAYKLKLTGRTYLGIGASWNVLQRFFDTNSFTTGSQYVLGKGFDANLAINEDFKDISGGYSSLETGMLLEKLYPTKEKHFYCGISLRDLNRPVYTSKVDRKERLRLQYGVQLGYQFLLNNQLSLLADGDLRFRNSNKWINLGIRMKYSWRNENMGIFQTGSIAIIPRYIVDKAYAIAIEVSQPFYSIRVGKSVNTSKINSNYMTSNEIVLSIKKNFKRKKKLSITTKFEKARGIIRKKKEEFSWDDEYWDYSSVDQHKIIDESLEKFLQTMIERMAKYKKSIIQIYVYTDMLDTEAKNLEVSLHRAEVIADYFKKYGISKDRVDYFGKGNSDPLIKNAFGQDRLKNRRIKFIIYR